MASQLQILNGALVRLGKTPNLTNAATAARQSTFGQDLVAAWPIVLRAELRKFPYNFARARANVAADTTAPAFGWSYRYPLPAEPRCLRVWDLNPGNPDWPTRPGKDFVVEGAFILTNRTAPLQVRYIADVQDATDFDEAFAKVMTVALAAFCAIKITGSSELAETLRKEAATELGLVQSIDSQEGDDDDGVAEQSGDFRSFRARYSG